MKYILAALALLGTLSFAHAESRVVALDTNHGRIVLELDADKAPLTVENFIGYVESGHYDGTVFHRVIDGFMIQGGGFDADMSQKPTRDPIRNEADNGLSNRAGTIAMARTQNPHSASAQFFINLVDNTSLDQPASGGWGYAVFGRVVGGMDVVQEIAQVRTGRSGMHRDVPTEPVVIDAARVVDTPAP